MVKLGSIAPLSYAPGELQYFAFVRGQVGADCHQAPDFHTLPDGRVRVVWSAYDRHECSSNCACLYSESADKGCTWTDPQVYFADCPGGNPKLVFLRPRDSQCALLFTTQARHAIEFDGVRRVWRAREYSECPARIALRTSSDGGLTFNHGEEFPYQLVTGGKEFPRIGFYGTLHGMIQLSNGRIVASAYYLDPDLCERFGGQHYVVAFLISDDEGRTWQRSNPISTDTPRGAMEPTMVETDPGCLYCLLRTQGGFLYETRSEDHGMTWGAPRASVLPSPESKPRMIRLHSGKLLLVWNNTSSTTGHPRHPLVAALSADGGRTWGAAKVIADETGLNQLSNHGLLQLEDGRILLGLSHYHARRPMTSDLDMALFDQAWLEG